MLFEENVNESISFRVTQFPTPDISSFPKKNKDVEIISPLLYFK